MGLWSGKLKHRMATTGGYSTVDLLNLTALVPDRWGALPLHMQTVCVHCTGLQPLYECMGCLEQREAEAQLQGVISAPSHVWARHPQFVAGLGCKALRDVKRRGMPSDGKEKVVEVEAS